MAQMLICLSLLLFREYGLGRCGGREGPNVVKMVSTHRDRPKGCLPFCERTASSARTINLKKTAGLFTIAHFRNYLPVL
jgi:hypothetical protein